MLRAGVLDKSLQELERSDWGEATYHTHLVTTVHRLRRVPLRQFTPEGLRIMIGQNIGLQFLVPLAIDQLRADPLTECDYYPGDLLKAVLSVDPKFWRGHPQLRRDVEDIAQRAFDTLRSPDARERYSPIPLEAVTEGYNVFQAATNAV